MLNSIRGPSLHALGMPVDTDWAHELASIGARRLTVLMDVSNRCNLRCRMCHFSYDSVFHRDAVFIEPERFSRLASQLFPLAHTVYLSAANEPLVSPHFSELIRIAGRYGIPNLKFLTNGLLMGPAIVEAILECGIDEIHVSVDGANRQTYEHIRRGGRFDQLIANLAHLRDVKARRRLEKPHVQFNLTLMRSNVDELPEFVDLAEELGVTRISARHLVLYEDLGMESESLSLSPDKSNESLLALFERAAASASVTITNCPNLFASEAHSTSTIRLSSNREPPLGHVDQPATMELAGSNAILFEGWALDSTGEVEVMIERDPVDGEICDRPGSGDRITLGRATFSTGIRPDVALAHPQYANCRCSSWSYELRRDALPLSEPFRIIVHVVASNPHGQRTTLGVRTVHFADDVVSAPFRYCTKPFDSIYVDAGGNVYPYPDCLGADSPGNLLEVDSFRRIWFGEQLTRLRRRILDRDPPKMCFACPNFVNGNVDEPRYFEPRDVERWLGGRAAGGTELT